MLYAFFWVIPRRLKFICRRFGTLCLFHLHRQVGVCVHAYLPVQMEQCSETSAYKLQTPGNYPKESIETIICFAQHYTRPVRKASSHFEYQKNRSRGLDVTWQPVRGDLTVHPWIVGLVSRQWDAVDWACVPCDRPINKSPHFERRF
jgi:hypothetical protein